MAIESVRENFPFLPNGAERSLYEQLCREVKIEDPFYTADGQDVELYRIGELVKEKHAISLESRGDLLGFRVDVRANRNCPYNSVFLFGKDFVSLIAWLNKHVLATPYKSDILARFGCSWSTIREVKHSLPYDNTNYF